MIPDFKPRDLHHLAVGRVPEWLRDAAVHELHRATARDVPVPGRAGASLGVTLDESTDTTSQAAPSLPRVTSEKSRLPWGAATSKRAPHPRLETDSGAPTNPREGTGRSATDRNECLT